MTASERFVAWWKSYGLSKLYWSHSVKQRFEKAYKDGHTSGSQSTHTLISLLQEQEGDSPGAGHVAALVSLVEQVADQWGHSVDFWEQFADETDLFASTQLEDRTRKNTRDSIAPILRLLIPAVRGGCDNIGLAAKLNSSGYPEVAQAIQDLSLEGRL